MHPSACTYLSNPDFCYFKIYFICRTTAVHTCLPPKNDRLYVSTCSADTTVSALSLSPFAHLSWSPLVIAYHISRRPQRLLLQPILLNPSFDLPANRAIAVASPSQTCWTRWEPRDGSYERRTCLTLRLDFGPFYPIWCIGWHPVLRGPPSDASSVGWPCRPSSLIFALADTLRGTGASTS
jgi:hypothetical protein